VEDTGNNGLVQWAKRKIGSIWRSNKRQKIEIVVNSNNKFLLTLSPGLPLTKTISYLEPCDVLNCIQTCKKWKIDIDKDEIWYEVAKSFSHNAVDAIIIKQQQQQDNDTSAAKTKSKLNYRNMAIAISRAMSDNNSHLPKKFPESKLNLKDVLVVFEMRDTGTNNIHLGSFCSDLTEMTESKPGLNGCVSYDSSKNKDRFSNIILQTKVVEEEEEEDYDGWCSGYVDAINRLEMRSRLIRQDTGKCVCLNDFNGIIEHTGGAEAYFNTYRDTALKPDAKNLSGTIARELCMFHDYNYIAFDLEFKMERLSDLVYKIQSFEFRLRVSKYDDQCANDEFNSMNHFLLFLEGLDWR
ncbi:MAG: hypothetical protein ACI8RD_002867, partial [Bacillariaceae sp.]|jgi:hypothetical protein